MEKRIKILNKLQKRVYAAWSIKRRSFGKNYLGKIFVYPTEEIIRNSHNYQWAIEEGIMVIESIRYDPEKHYLLKR